MSNMKSLRFFGLFSIFDSLSFFAPIRAIYFYQVTDSYTQAASLLSLIWIFSALLEVPTGIFSDLIGRKKTMVLGALTILLGYVFYALGSDYWVLALGTLFHGAGRAFHSGNDNAYLYNLSKESSDENTFSRYYGKLNSYVSVAAFIAALLSGVIAGWSIRNMMWISVFTQFMAFFFTTQLREVHSVKNETTNIYAHLKDSIMEVKNNINLRFLSLANIFGGAGSAAYEFQSVVFSAVWPMWAVGVARAFQEIGSTPGYWFADKIIKKIGAVKVVMLQTTFSWVLNVLASILQSFFSPFLILGHFIFYGPSDTANEDLIQKEFTERQRATIASLNSLGNNLYFALVTNIAGLVASLYNPFIGLLITQIFFLPVIYFRWRLFRRAKVD